VLGEHIGVALGSARLEKKLGRFRRLGFWLALAYCPFISKMTSHWICWDQLSQQIQPVPNPSGSRRLAQTFNDILGPAFQFWLIEPDQRHRSRI